MAKEIKIIGVEPDDAACLYEALKAKERVVLDSVGIFADGVAVMEILMGLYLSSETGNTVRFPNPDLENYVPVVARR